MARLDPRSKRALIALAIIAVSVMVADGLVSHGGPVEYRIGGLLMWVGPLVGVSFFVFSLLIGRKKTR